MTNWRPEGERRDLKCSVPGGADVSAVLVRPPDARAIVVLGHGAGAGMRHRFMEAISDGLAQRGLATLRYQFPYMELGRRAPDRAPVLVATVGAAVELARHEADDLPLLAGGKSMGGRMTSIAVSEGLAGPRGLLFFGFPLHPPGRPGTARAAHLEHVGIPMLFLQGDRDRLADLELLRTATDPVRDLATLHVVRGADHSFHVLKRSGRTDAEALAELADRAATWTSDIVSRS